MREAEDSFGGDTPGFGILDAMRRLQELKPLKHDP
jgi:hypothetical protein